MGNDVGVFDIKNGVLTFKQSPNYEDAEGMQTTNTTVTVVATDSDNQMAMMTVTVMVTNVDEAGMLTLSTLQPVDGIPVMTATLTDIDGAVMVTLPGSGPSPATMGAPTPILTGRRRPSTSRTRTT